MPKFETACLIGGMLRKYKVGPSTEPWGMPEKQVEDQVKLNPSEEYLFSWRDFMTVVLTFKSVLLPWMFRTSRNDLFLSNLI